MTKEVKDGPALRLRGLYPLDPWLLPPVIWGSHELQQDFGKSAPADAKLGESWEVSCVPGRESTISGSAVTLASAVASAPAHFMGSKEEARPAAFPLLVKLLATSTFLSVQVHPDDAQAARLEGSPNGKHEAWAVLAAVHGAEVLAGLAPDATAESLFDAARSGDAELVRAQLAHHVVQAGDVVDVPAGCVHAPGPGLVLYEVQQPVDLTYRIFDWGRLGLDGKPRPLHVDKARAVIDPNAKPSIRRVGASSTRPIMLERLVSTGVFALDRIAATGRHELPGGALLLVTCTGGRGTLSAGEDSARLSRGKSCVVPAATRDFVIEGEGLELLVASRP